MPADLPNAQAIGPEAVRDPRVWLIGENNPYGAAPYFALYPEPYGCAGWRLCHLVLGMQPAAYLRVFERRNLLALRRWSAPAARAAAAALADEIPTEDAVVLFGRRVWDAWMNWPGRAPIAWTPFGAQLDDRVLALPHPSGLCRMWSVPGAFARGRAAVAELAPELRPLLGAREEARRAG